MALLHTFGSASALSACFAAAACSVAVLCGLVLSWRHSGGQVCVDDGHLSFQAMYVCCSSSSFWQVSSRSCSSRAADNSVDKWLFFVRQTRHACCNLRVCNKDDKTKDPISHMFPVCGKRIFLVFGLADVWVTLAASVVAWRFLCLVHVWVTVAAVVVASNPVAAAVHLITCIAWCSLAPTVHVMPRDTTILSWRNGAVYPGVFSDVTCYSILSLAY